MSQPAFKRLCIYIAGPITGMVDGNKLSFYQAEELLHNMGHSTVNPWRVAGDQTDWCKALRADLAEMFARCDSLVLLPGWERSKGAMLELHNAFHTGMTIFPTIGAVPMNA